MTRLLNQLLVPAKVAGFLSVLILLLMACTPTEAALIQGILQDVDSANGEITIVTREGKTITLTISSDDIVNADGATSSFDSLVPGVSIEADVAGGQQVSGKVRILQAEDEGSSEDQGSSEDEGDGAHDEASEDEEDSADDVADEDEKGSEDDGS